MEHSLKLKETPFFCVIIAGSRDFLNYEFLCNKVSYIISTKKKNYKIVIVSGCAKGADTLAIKFAKENNFLLKKFPAEWDKYGKKDGFLRNQEMAKYSDALIAFWDGKSKGTKHMIDISRQEKSLTRVIMYKQYEKNVGCKNW